MIPKIDWNWAGRKFVSYPGNKWLWFFIEGNGLEHKGIEHFIPTKFGPDHWFDHDHGFCMCNFGKQIEGRDIMIEMAFSKHKPIFEAPKLLAVPSIYESNFRDVPKSMREIADAIERGDYSAESVAIVMIGDETTCFHMGQGQALEAYVLFDMGKEFLRGAVMDGMKDR